MDSTRFGTGLLPTPSCLHVTPRQVNSHLTGGMANLFTVNGTAPPPTTGGIERTYYIAADEVVWDYAPLNGTACTTDGSVLPFDDVASTYLGPPEGMRLGSK